MKPADAARLVALAAIWGASFLFIRIAAPVIGPAATSFDAQWRRWWRYYLLIGALNSAAPFPLYGYSALELSVGLMAVLNAISPMWGALLSALMLNERLSRQRFAGLVLGIAGVALVCGPEGGGRWRAIAASLGAAFCYGLTGVVLRRRGRETSARGMAAGTPLMGGVLLLPLVAISAPPARSSS